MTSAWDFDLVDPTVELESGSLNSAELDLFWHPAAAAMQEFERVTGGESVHAAAAWHTLETIPSQLAGLKPSVEAGVGPRWWRSAGGRQVALTGPAGAALTHISWSLAATGEVVSVQATVQSQTPVWSLSVGKKGDNWVVTRSDNRIQRFALSPGGTATAIAPADLMEQEGLGLTEFLENVTQEKSQLVEPELDREVTGGGEPYVLKYQRADQVWAQRLGSLRGEFERYRGQLKEIQAQVDRFKQAVRGGPAAAGVIKCPKCDADTRGRAFCTQCGHRMETKAAAVCTACGVQLRPGVAFCSQCGKPTNAPKPAQAGTAPAVAQPSAVGALWSAMASAGMAAAGAGAGMTPPGSVVIPGWPPVTPSDPAVLDPGRPGPQHPPPPPLVTQILQTFDEGGMTTTPISPNLEHVWALRGQLGGALAPAAAWVGRVRGALGARVGGAMERLFRAACMLPGAYRDLAENRSLQVEAWLVLLVTSMVRCYGLNVVLLHRWLLHEKVTHMFQSLETFFRLWSNVRAALVPPFLAILSLLVFAGAGALISSALCGREVGARPLFRVLVYSQGILMLEGLLGSSYLLQIWALMTATAALHDVTELDFGRSLGVALSGLLSGVAVIAGVSWLGQL